MEVYPVFGTNTELEARKALLVGLYPDNKNLMALLRDTVKSGLVSLPSQRTRPYWESAGGAKPNFRGCQI